VRSTVNQLPTLDVQTVALLLSHPYAGGTYSCFPNQPLRWWYIPTLEVQSYAGGTPSTDAVEQSSI